MNRLGTILILSMVAGCGGGAPELDGGSAGGMGAGGMSVGGGSGGGSPAPAPMNFAATVESATSVRLTWAQSSPPPDRFELERSGSVGGPYALIAQPLGADVTWLDTGLTAGVTYWYRLRSVTFGVPSDTTNPVSATPIAVNAPPTAPTNVVVTTPTEQSLTVTWTDTSTNETSFEVQRAPASTGPWFTFATRPANTTSVVDTGLAPGTPFHYRVRALNALGPSPYSTSGAGVTGVPNAPTGFTAAQEVLNMMGVIRLTWVDNSSAEGQYQVERSTDQLNWTLLPILPADSTGYVDSGAVFGTNYYRVRAVSGLAASSYANASVYNGPVSVGFFCSAPTSHSATATTTAIRLAYTYQSNYPCQVVAIERSTSSIGPFSEVARTTYPSFIFPGPPLATTWDDTTAVPGVTYFYRLRTVGGVNGAMTYGGSGYTTVVSAAVAAMIPAPTNVQVTVLSAVEASFSFTDPAPDEDGFDLELATNAGGPFSQLGRLAANTTIGTLFGLSPNTGYWLRVRTARGGAVSPPSAAAAFTTASRLELRTTADVTVMKSTAVNNNQNMNLSGSFASTGCFFTATPSGGGAFYQFHNCAGSLLQFNTSAIVARTVVAAWLVMKPCGLAPGPVTGSAPAVLNANYTAFALAGPWNPSTVTYNTMPMWYLASAPSSPAPTTTGETAWNITEIARNWATTAWASNGLFVQQFPVVDRVPPPDSQGNRNWDQTTNYCSLEQNGGNLANAPRLIVDVR